MPDNEPTNVSTDDQTASISDRVEQLSEWDDGRCEVRIQAPVKTQANKAPAFIFMNNLFPSKSPFGHGETDVPDAMIVLPEEGIILRGGGLDNYTAGLYCEANGGMLFRGWDTQLHRREQSAWFKPNHPEEFRYPDLVTALIALAPNWKGDGHEGLTEEEFERLRAELQYLDEVNVEINGWTDNGLEPGAFMRTPKLDEMYMIASRERLLRGKLKLETKGPAQQYASICRLSLALLPGEHFGSADFRFVGKGVDAVITFDKDSAEAAYNPQVAKQMLDELRTAQKRGVRMSVTDRGNYGEVRISCQDPDYLTVREREEQAEACATQTLIDRVVKLADWVATGMYKHTPKEKPRLRLEQLPAL